MFRFFERFADPFPKADASPPPKGLLRFLWHYARQFRGVLGAIVALSVLNALIEVSLFAILGGLVDLLVDADPSTFWDEHGTTVILSGLLILVLYPAVAALSELVMLQGLMGNFAMAVRWRAHRTLLRQPVKFFQDEFAGRIATKVMQTSLAIRDVVVPLTERFTFMIVYIVSALVLFAEADWRLTVPLLAWIVAYGAAMRFFLPRLRDRSAAQADARALMTGRIVDSYTNISTVKMFAHTAREEGYARDAMGQFLETVYRQMRMVTLTTSTVYFLNAALLVSTAALSIWLWQFGAVTTGAIALAIALVLRLHGMSEWIMWELAQLSENVGTAQDGMNTLSTPLTLNDQPDAEPLTVAKGEVRFEGVSFGYGMERGVIHGLDLIVRPGEKVGLIGRSGAGKSTLVNLLLRFHDVERGAVTIDGRDVRKVTQESLRAAVSVVSQDTAMLHRSIRDNIAYGKPDASEEEIERAARQAEALDFILDLEDSEGRRGFDAHAGERGVKLSGGQRQRIAIARVLLKDAPILVLDEATSALDSEVEAAIQCSLFRLMEGKTVIAIAHRLSTIAALDRLVVLDRGRIVEQGTHDELLRKGGLYASLWARQSGGFLYGAQQAGEAEAAE